MNELETSKEVTGDLVQQGQDYALDPDQDVNEAIRRYDRMKAYIEKCTKEGVDYGIIPGTKKKSMWDPCATKLLFFHGFGVRHEPVREEMVIDWGLKTGFPFFNYCYRAVVFHKRTGKVIGDCKGSANSLEARFQEWVKESVLTKAQMDRKDLLPWRQDEGEEKEYRVESHDVYGLANTIDKRAQKRARVGAAIIVCRAATDFVYSQDHEEEDTKGSPVVSANTSGSKVKDACEFKKGTGSKGPWVLYKVTLEDGTEATTFDKTFYQLAKTAKDKKYEVFMSTKKGKYGLDMVGFKVANQGPVPEPKGEIVDAEVVEG